MRLTVEDNREAIKRYRHIKPARGRRRGTCPARLSGTNRACTLEGGHSGPHVAHVAFGKVVAVWDEMVVATKVAEQAKAKGEVRALARTDLRDRGLVAALKDFGGRLVRNPEHFMEEILFLAFFLVMAGFVLDWALRLLG